MPDEIPQDGGTATETTTPAPAGGTAPATTPAAAATQAGPAGNPSVITVPTHAMKKIKADEYAKGQQAALQQMAADNGFATVEEMNAALGRAKQPAPAAQPTRAAATPNEEGLTPDELVRQRDSRRVEARAARQIETLTGERNRFQTELQKQAAAAKAAQSEAEALRAEMHLRTMAAREGVQDIDYAIILFSRHLETLTAPELEKFDEKAWFQQLRASKPLLYGETVVPATSATGPGSTPAPPKPNAAAAAAATGARANVAKMNPAEFQAELRRRGIAPA